MLKKLGVVRITGPFAILLLTRLLPWRKAPTAITVSLSATASLLPMGRTSAPLPSTFKITKSRFGSLAMTPLIVYCADSLSDFTSQL